jgi:hypothetical protein
MNPGILVPQLGVIEMAPFRGKKADPNCIMQPLISTGPRDTLFYRHGWHIGNPNRFRHSCIENVAAFYLFHSGNRDTIRSNLGHPWNKEIEYEERISEEVL